MGFHLTQLNLKMATTVRTIRKEKKISIKYYLNTKAKPVIDGKTKMYPLYLRITYDRQTTKIKVIPGGGELAVLIDEKKFNDENPLSSISKNLVYPLYCEPDKIKSLIRKLNSNSSNDFSLKGFSDVLFHTRFAVLIDATDDDSGIHFKNLIESQLQRKLSIPDKSIDTIVAKVLDLEDGILFFIELFPNIVEQAPSKVRINLLVGILLQLFESHMKGSGVNGNTIEPIDSRLTPYDWFFSGIDSEFKKFVERLRHAKEIKSLPPTHRMLITNLNFNSKDIEKYQRHIEETLITYIRE